MSYKKQFQHDRTDVYQKVTDYVIESLKKGVVPWQQKWCSYGLPRNVTSSHIYREWNVFNLNFVTLRHQYKTPFFITFDQAIASGGNIRKGERGYPVTYWTKIQNKFKSIKKETKVGEGKEYNRCRIVPKLYIVFNIDQTENIVFSHPQAIEKTPNEKITECVKIVEQMPQCPPIRHRGNKPFYSPLLDFIQLPFQEQFDSTAYYYNHLFCELAYSTGHQSRLNRREITQSVSLDKLSAKEQLIAELTAGFLCAVTGIERKPIDDSAAYINHWLHNLRRDKTLILKAASQAQGAADFILNSSAKQAESISTQPEAETATDTKAIHA